MKAIALKSFGGVNGFVAMEWPMPEPKPGEVRIEIKATSFNPVDWKIRQGRFDTKLPLVLGHDAAGIVDAVGEGVSEFVKGDRVYTYLGGPQSNGSYAEYVCIASEFVDKIPGNLSWEQATASVLVGLTALEAISVKANLQSEETIFIAGGTGGVGSMAIQLAQYFGAKSILTTAGNEESVQFLTQTFALRTEHIICYRGFTHEQLAKKIIIQNQGRFVEVALDLVGGEMKKLACEIIQFGSRVASIVEEPVDFVFNIFNSRQSPLFAKSATFHFVFLGARGIFGSKLDWIYYRKLLNHFTMLLGGQCIKPSLVNVIGPFNVNTVKEAHQLLEHGHIQGKLVMQVNQ